MILYGQTLVVQELAECQRKLGIVPGGGINQLTGDVTAGPGTGSQVATIAADAVSNAKLADMAANSIKGNNTVGAANPVDLTATQATAMLNQFTSVLKGLVPASGGGTTNFLRADGSWTTAPDTGITQLTGDVTAGPGSGSQIATIPADTVTNAKLADMPANTIKGNNTAGAINPLDLTVAQVVALLNAVVATRAINTTAPLTGGGTLAADLTLAITAATASAAGSESAADFIAIRNVIAMGRAAVYLS